VIAKGQISRGFPKFECGESLPPKRSSASIGRHS
jgi:hypothetical protein